MQISLAMFIDIHKHYLLRYWVLTMSLVWISWKKMNSTMLRLLMTSALIFLSPKSYIHHVLHSSLFMFFLVWFKSSHFISVLLISYLSTALHEQRENGWLCKIKMWKLKGRSRYLQPCQRGRKICSLCHLRPTESSPGHQTTVTAHGRSVYSSLL